MNRKNPTNIKMPKTYALENFQNTYKVLYKTDTNFDLSKKSRIYFDIEKNLENLKLKMSACERQLIIILNTANCLTVKIQPRGLGKPLNF